MEDFHVESEKRKRPVLKTALLTVLGVATVGALWAAARRPMGGDVMPLDRIPLTREEALAAADKVLGEGFGLKFEHDVPLTLTDSAGHTITFTADGWDASKKFAYEILDYDYYRFVDDASQLTEDERVPIRGSAFGKYQILLIDSGNRYAISNAVANYAAGRTNR